MNGSLNTFFDNLYREGPYEVDRPLMEELGLKTVWHNRQEFVDVGTVVIHEAEERYGLHAPATEVKVEVCAMPAQFWRFTILRAQDGTKDIAKGEGYHGQGWEPVYEPREEIVVQTGSGAFREYWPGIKNIAEHCFEVEHKGDES